MMFKDKEIMKRWIMLDGGWMVKDDGQDDGKMLDRWTDDVIDTLLINCTIKRLVRELIMDG